LVNTELAVRDQRVDLLGSPRWWRAWLGYQQHRIEPVLGGPITDQMCSATTLGHVRNLRGAAAVVIGAARTGQCPDASAVTDLDAALHDAALHDAALHDAAPATLSDTEAVCMALAQGVIDLASSAQAADIRECAAPGCTQLFLSAQPARQWCTSWTCGNRARAARHYQRRRPATVEIDQKTQNS
jgi:predicted RNA-binding Zn ribbon-like protein